MITLIVCAALVAAFALGYIIRGLPKPTAALIAIRNEAENKLLDSLLNYEHDAANSLIFVVERLHALTKS